MKDFYSKEENFIYLYNDIRTLLSNKIVESSLAENWLANWYVCNKYNTTRAVEKYAANILIPRLKVSEIPEDSFKSIIDKKLNKCYESYNETPTTLEDKLYMIDHIQKIKINESTLSYLIQDFECDDIVEYIRESYYNDSKNDDSIPLTESFKTILNIISNIKNSIVENREDREKLEFIKECNDSILYKYKYTETFIIETSSMYETLEDLLLEQDDRVIDYTLDELNNSNKLIEHLIQNNLDESSDAFIYNKAIEKFDKMVESIFFEDSEIKIDDVVKLYELTEAICDYELTLEASSRIITKGTEKVTKSIGNASSKGSGMSASDSKIGQIKRGAKIVDDRASDALNRKIDQILNFTQDQKREKIITGKNTIRLSKVLKQIIGLIVAGGLIKSSPLIGAGVTIIGLLGARALSKATEQREKRRIMLDLETELKITREKIEDAKGDNAKEQKYQLMRIEAQLEKEIFRIKHGLKYY